MSAPADVPAEVDSTVDRDPFAQEQHAACGHAAEQSAIQTSHSSAELAHFYGEQGDLLELAQPVADADAAVPAAVDEADVKTEIFPSEEGSILSNKNAVNIHLNPDEPLLVEDGLVLNQLDVLNGTGEIKGDVVSSGTVSPGNSPGINTITGDLTLTSTNTTLIEIADGNGVAGIDFDQIQVSGSATLDGVLDIDLLGGFIPTIGQTFEFLKYDSDSDNNGTLTGAFSDAAGLFGFGDGSLYFDIVNDVVNKSLKLEVKALLGNGDLKVDAGANNDNLGKFFSSYFSDASVTVEVDIHVNDFVSLSGGIGFQKSGNDLIAIGSSVTAGLSAGPASLNLSGAEFGLQNTSTGTLFELKGGSFSGSLGSGTVSATSVFIRYADATSSVTSGTTISLGSVDYVFNETINPNTTVLKTSGFVTNIPGFFNVSGDFDFDKNGDEFTMSGDATSLSLTSGPIEVSGAVAFALSRRTLDVDTNSNGEADLLDATLDTIALTSSGGVSASIAGSCQP